jgi:hypothetical protein
VAFVCTHGHDVPLHWGVGIRYLIFADRAILIEGATERLLLPEMIRKSDNTVTGDTDTKLGSQYLSIMEVGGAYAHRFFNLLGFLNLRTLIITDFDTVDGNNNGRKCKVSEGTQSSNACINIWFTTNGADNPTKDELLEKRAGDKVAGNRLLAFQIPHVDGDACGRSFEDAFMLANPSIFDITGTTWQEREDQAWKAAEKVNKTDFALEYAIEKTNWITPRYIEEGLRWLAGNASSTASSGEAAAPTAEEAEGNADD